MRRHWKLWAVLGCAIVLGVVLTITVVTPGLAQDDNIKVHKIFVPEEDRFTPFNITVHRGDTVAWINKDTDDHTVVSDDVWNSAGHNHTNVLLNGTVSNGGKPGRFRLTFDKAGTFVYYCRFHSTLDADNQPIAPGPDGGIAGTPMMGVVTVLP